MVLNTYNYQKANAGVLIDRDKVNLASQAQVANATVRLFDRIQSLRPEVQLLALAAAFTLLVEASKYNPQDAMTSVSNLMKDRKNSTGRDSRFDAMKHHIKEELIRAR